jgi:hypothetical protein
VDDDDNTKKEGGDGTTTSSAAAQEETQKEYKATPTIAAIPAASAEVDVPEKEWKSQATATASKTTADGKRQRAATSTPTSTTRYYEIHTETLPGAFATPGAFASDDRPSLLLPASSMYASGAQARARARAHLLELASRDQEEEEGGGGEPPVEPPTLVLDASPTDHTLATARPVSDDDDGDSSSLDNNLQHAEPVHLEQPHQEPQRQPSQQQRQQRHKTAESRQGRWLVAVAIAAVIVVIVGVGLGVGLSGDSEDVTKIPKELNQTDPQLLVPKENNETLTRPQRQGILEALLPPDTVQAFSSQPDSPQAQALEWMLQDPYWENYSPARLVQRFALATFYYATQGPTQWIHAPHWLDYTVPECHWHVSTFAEFQAFQNQVESPSTPFPNMTAFQHDQPCDPDGEEVYHHFWMLQHNLQGTTPSELFLLTCLQSILLANNDQLVVHLDYPSSSSSYDEDDDDHNRYPIPQQLQFLVVFNNQDLSSPLPTTLGYWTHLQVLVVSGNLHPGTIPTELGLLTQLTHLAMPRNVRRSVSEEVYLWDVLYCVHVSWDGGFLAY